MKKILLILFLLIALAGFSQNRVINLDEGCYISNDTLFCGYDTLVGVPSTFAGVSNTYYVDSAYTGTSTGGILSPFKTILEALTFINADAADLATAGLYPQSKYVLKVAPGTYTDNLIINNQKYLRIEMAGVIISGTVDIVTTQQTGNYYSKLEFWGGMSNRPEKGDNGEISGVITCTRNNDALQYLSFTGMEISNNLLFETNGTWVVFLNHAYFSNGSAFISGDFSGGGAPSVLIESMGKTRIKAHIADTDGSSTNVALYDCSETEFDLINISSTFGGILRNNTFKSDVTISAGTYKIDNVSYKEIEAQTENLTGATISYLDSYNGGDVDVVGTVTSDKVYTDSILTRRISFAGVGGDEYITQVAGFMGFYANNGLKAYISPGKLSLYVDTEPNTSNTYNLGSSSNIWNSAYFRRQYIFGQKTSNDLFLATNENSGLIGDSAVVIDKLGNILIGGASTYISGDNNNLEIFAVGGQHLRIGGNAIQFYKNMYPYFNLAAGIGVFGRKLSSIHSRNFTDTIGYSKFGSRITIDGNKTSSNLFEAINDNDGLLGDSSVYIDPAGNLNVQGTGTFSSYGQFTNNTVVGANQHMLYYGSFNSGDLYYSGVNNWDFKNMTFGVVNPKTSYNLAEFINDADGLVGDSSLYINKLGQLFGGGQTFSLGANSTVVATATKTSGTNVFSVANNLNVGDSLETVYSKITGGQTVNITTVNTATYDLLATDYILNVTYTTTGAVTSLTLPTAQTVSGRIIVIKDAGGNATSNNITIDTEASETIDGSATLVINGNYDSVNLYSDGSNWFIY